jgi:uncharacterized membrane protein YdbT with pleckstrin-like domain
MPVFRNEGVEEKAMSSQSFNTFNGPAQYPSSQYKGSALRGVLIGLIPLVLLLVLVAVTFLLTAPARQLVASSGFFAQQQAALIVLIIGLVMALVVYIIAIVRTLRRVKAWQKGGALGGQARAALLALGLTALVVLLPVVLALVLPQNPAP